LEEDAMGLIQFTRNYRDHSNEQGYQFEFFCDKCGNGFRSSFQANKLGMATSLLRAASSIFGGALGGAAQGADYMKNAFRGEGWDAAFTAAVAEAKPKFCQCTRCGKWVCPAVCWNEKRTLCEACAPDLAEEGSAVQARVATEQLEEKMRAVDQVKHVAVDAPALAACPHCNARVEGGGKFCLECGKPLAVQVTCAKCSAKYPAFGKFCPECGEPHKPG
jgi:hypothetical protein